MSVTGEAAEHLHRRGTLIVEVLESLGKLPRREVVACGPQCTRRGFERRSPGADERVEVDWIVGQVPIVPSVPRAPVRWRVGVVTR